MSTKIIYRQPFGFALDLIKSVIHDCILRTDATISVEKKCNAKKSRSMCFLVDGGW